MKTQRVIVTLRKDYVNALDELVKRGIAPSRNSLIERIIGGFLSDLKEKRQTGNSALGNLIGFILLMVGIGIVASIFEDDSDN